MQYKPYGKTGKLVSCVGFGGMRFDMSKSLEENAEIVRYASAQGINYFDTAPGYCDDQSEVIYGEAFKAMPNEFYVSTKAMPTDFDTKEKAKERARKSLDKLGVPKIHFYHIWCLRKPEHYALAMRPGGQYEGLLELKEEGLIDHIVCSSHQPGSEIKQIIDDGKLDGVLLGLNILNFPYRWDGVQAAHAAGCGVVAMNPLGGGAIPGHEKEFAFLAGPGETPTDAALRFVIGCPEVSVALVGFTTREQIDQACRIAAEARSFAPHELERIKEQLGRNMNEFCTACNYCQDCPNNIPVASYMQIYNDKTLFGHNEETMVNAMGFHLDWGLVASRQADASECIECRLCEEACTQHLPIIERLKEIAGWEEQKKKQQKAL